VNTTATQDKLRQYKLRQDKLRQDKLRKDKLRQEKLRQEKLRQDKLRQDKLRQSISSHHLCRKYFKSKQVNKLNEENAIYCTASKCNAMSSILFKHVQIHNIIFKFWVKNSLLRKFSL